MLHKTTLAEIDAGSHREARDRRAIHPKALGEGSLGLTRSVLRHQSSGVETALHLLLPAVLGRAQEETVPSLTTS
jgi:hypothetical protein